MVPGLGSLPRQVTRMESDQILRWAIVTITWLVATVGTIVWVRRLLTKTFGPD